MLIYTKGTLVPFLYDLFLLNTYNTYVRVYVHTYVL